MDYEGFVVVVVCFWVFWSLEASIDKPEHKKEAGLLIFKSVNLYL